MRPPIVTNKQVGVLVVKASELLPTQSLVLRQATPNTTKTTYDNQIIYVVGSLKDILKVQGIYGAYSVHAYPNDTYGCTAEYVDGQGWIGCLGRFLTQEDFENTITTNVNLGIGAWVFVGDANTGVSMLVFQ